MLGVVFLGKGFTGRAPTALEWELIRKAELLSRRKAGLARKGFSVVRFRGVLYYTSDYLHYYLLDKD